MKEELSKFLKSFANSGKVLITCVRLVVNNKYNVNVILSNEARVICNGFMF